MAPSKNPKLGEADEFTHTIHSYLASIGRPWKKLPMLGGVKLPLQFFYQRVVSLGGCHLVNHNKRWGSIAKEMRVPKTCTNPSFILKRAYLYFLYEYEGEQHPSFDRSIPIDIAPSSLPHTTYQPAQVVARPAAPHRPTSVAAVQRSSHSGRGAHRGDKREKIGKSEKAAHRSEKAAQKAERRADKAGDATRGAPSSHTSAEEKTVTAMLQQLAAERSRPIRVPEEYEVAAKRKVLMSLQCGIQTEVDWALSAMASLAYTDTPYTFDGDDRALDILLYVALQPFKHTLSSLFEVSFILRGLEVDDNSGEIEEHLERLREHIARNPPSVLPPFFDENDMSRVGVACTIIRNLSMKPDNASYLGKSWVRMLDLLSISCYLPAAAAASLVEAVTSGMGDAFTRLAAMHDDKAPSVPAHVSTSNHLSTKEFDDGSEFLKACLLVCNKLRYGISMGTLSPAHAQSSVGDIATLRVAILYLYASCLRLASKDAAKGAWTEEWEALFIEAVMEEEYVSVAVWSEEKGKFALSRALSALQALWLVTLHHGEISAKVGDSLDMMRAISSRVFHIAKAEPGSITVPTAVLLNLLKQSRLRHIVHDYESELLEMLGSAQTKECAGLILYFSNTKPVGEVQKDGK